MLLLKSKTDDIHYCLNMDEKEIRNTILQLSKSTNMVL